MLTLVVFGNEMDSVPLFIAMQEGGKSSGQNPTGKNLAGFGHTWESTLPLHAFSIKCHIFYHCARYL